jgi:hypothetical protein
MKSLHALALTAAASAPLLFFACSGSGLGPLDRSDASADASTDVNSARPDRNVRNPDAGEWSWLPGGEEHWAPSPGLPNFCEIRIAQTPEKDLPPLQWEACPSGRAGCTRLVIDWSPPVIGGRQSITVISNPVFRTRDGQTYVHYHRHYPYPQNTATFDRVMEVAYRLNGEAVFAIATDLRDRGEGPGSLRCSPAMSVGNGGLAYYTHLSREDTSIFTSASWNDLRQPTVSREFGVKEFLGGGPSQIVNEGSVVITSVADVGSSAIVDISKNTLLFSKDPGGGVAQLEDFKPVVGGAVAFRVNNQVQLDFVRTDATATRLVRAPGTRHVCGFAIDRGDNESLVWVESDTIQPASNTVLFTAPRATSEASLVRRRVTAFDDTDGLCGGRMIANGGYALIRVSEAKALLIRLSDGAGWEIAAEPGTVFLKEVWVDDQDVWLATGVKPLLDAGSDAVFEDGLMRFTRASLGPPTLSAR